MLCSILMKAWHTRRLHAVLYPPAPLQVELLVHGVIVGGKSFRAAPGQLGKRCLLHVGSGLLRGWPGNACKQAAGDGQQPTAQFTLTPAGPAGLRGRAGPGVDGAARVAEGDGLLEPAQHG
jgi:hypothetical protein